MNLFARVTWSISLVCLVTSQAFANGLDTPSIDLKVMPREGEGAQFSSAQIAEMQSRVELANTIVQNMAADTHAKGLDDSWRSNLFNSLLNTPSVSLRYVAANATTLDQMNSQLPTTATKGDISTTPRPEILGERSGSLVYTPIQPCRYIDTRMAKSGPLTFTPREFISDRDGSEYGGTTGCKIGPPSGAFAIAANITIASPVGGPGFLSVRPTVDSPQTSWLNWTETGPAVAVANAGIITTDLGSYNFTMNVGGNAKNNVAQVIVDFFGYFSAAQSSAMGLDCQDVNVNSVTIAVGQVGSVAVSCSQAGAGYSLTGGGCDTTSPKGYILSSKRSDTENNVWTCKYTNQDSTFGLIAAYARCCAVPAR